MTDLSLRVDGDLRRRRAADPSPERKLALATCLVRHNAPSEALEELRDVPGEAADEARLRACKLLPVVDRQRLWSTLVPTATSGRTAFDLALLDGDERRAEDIARNTANAEGVELRAELALRRGQDVDLELGPAHQARRTWLRGDLPTALRHAEEATDDPEAGLLAAAAARRVGEPTRARSHLDRARSLARVPMPGIALEALLQHLTHLRIRVRERDLLEPLALLGERTDRTRWWPDLRGLRSRLGLVDEAIGCFRGEILTTFTSGTLRTLPGADDLRHRAAALRTGLRVTELEHVLAKARVLDAPQPHSPHVPAYVAELLHWFGRHDEAGASCEEAIRRDPSVRWPWVGLAQAQMWTGNLAAAERTLARLARRHPKLPSLPPTLGELAFLQGDTRRAIPLLRTATALHPTRRATWLLLIEALRASGAHQDEEALTERIRSAWPEAWIGDPRAQLTALRGNRSSSFITLFPSDREPMLLQGPRLAPDSD